MQLLVIMQTELIKLLNNYLKEFTNKQPTIWIIYIIWF